MFRYSIKQGWEEIPEAEGKFVLENFSEDPSGLGFGCRNKLAVCVYKRKRKTAKSAETVLKDQFLARVAIGEMEKGEKWQEVLLPALPDLLGFTNQVLPVCVETRIMGEADEKLHDQVDQVLQKYK